MPDRGIGLVDTTVRDGHQSLWSANALSTPIRRDRPTLDRAGFHAVDLTSSTHMAMAVRWHGRPVGADRVVRDLMPKTRLGFITPGMRFMAWWQAPVDVMRLALVRDPERCSPHLGRRVDERRHDRPRDRRDRERGGSRRGRGRPRVLALPGPHRRLLRSPGPSDRREPSRGRPGAEDPAGYSPRIPCAPWCRRSGPPSRTRARASLPHDRDDGRSLLAEAAELGSSYLCTAARPLANGTSQPSAEQTIANLREQGFRVDVDDDVLDKARYFTGLAAELDLPVGHPRVRTPGYKHQLPGGMTSTLRRSSRRSEWSIAGTTSSRSSRGSGKSSAGRSGDAAVAVRRRPGVPERHSGERWSRLPDEMIRYVLGEYGPPAGEVDPDLKARVHSSPRAEELAGKSAEWDSRARAHSATPSATSSCLADDAAEEQVRR